MGNWPLLNGVAEAEMWDDSQWVLEKALARLHELGSSGLLKVSMGPDDKYSNAIRVKVGILVTQAIRV